MVRKLGIIALSTILFLGLFLRTSSSVANSDENSGVAASKERAGIPDSSQFNSLKDYGEELDKRRSALIEKERALQEYEKRIQEREKEVETKMNELATLRAAITGDLGQQKKENDERVNKMVSVFETMSPKSSSAVLETLDDWLAVEVLKRMSITKMAKIMNIMDKERSAKLSEMMTGHYSKSSNTNTFTKSAGQAEARVPASAAPAVPAAKPQSSVQSDANSKKGG